MALLPTGSDKLLEISTEKLNVVIKSRRSWQGDASNRSSSLVLDGRNIKEVKIAATEEDIECENFDYAHYEFEIPFWVYCSPSYRASHPDIYMQIVQAKHRRFMTDALPHMLLYLAGIHAKDYRKEYNVLSPDYNESRHRILKNTADYDKIRDQHNMKKNK